MTSFDYILTAILGALLYILFTPHCHGEALPAVRVVDGDTFVLTDSKERIRVRGVDTPELRGGSPAERIKAQKAKESLEILLSNGYSLTRYGHDRYGRTVADVVVRGENIADVLIARGLAKPCYIGLPKARREALRRLYEAH
jgi:micrococcal nuclease